MICFETKVASGSIKFGLPVVDNSLEVYCFYWFLHFTWYSEDVITELQYTVVLKSEMYEIIPQNTNSVK